MTDTINAPWTSEQVDVLNRFQQEGGAHPFTCAELHTEGRSPVLEASHSGWYCPSPDCDFTQDWAFASMANPDAWPKPLAANERQTPSAPIRRSDLPPTRSPESEIFTWFPHPGGGGDMVRGQRQRGVQLRRRVTYGDWEPVHPERWADEPEQQEAPTATDAAARPRYTVLLARLERDRARSERGAAECRLEATARINEGEEAAFRAAIVHTLRVFCGPDAVAAYMRDGALPVVAAPATPGDCKAVLTAEPVAREHIGGNAEECPGCDGTNPPYPFICPGPPGDA